MALICIAGSTRASSLEELPPACSSHKNRSRAWGFVASHQGTLLWVCYGCHWQLSDYHSISHLPIIVLPQALRCRDREEGEVVELFHCGPGYFLRFVRHMDICPVIATGAIRAVDFVSAPQA